MSLNKSILAMADEIVNQRSEEKERQYGPFGKGMERAAAIASGMAGKNFTAHDMFISLIALKFSRQSYNHKEDNLMDAAAYIGAWQNYINECTPESISSEDLSTATGHGCQLSRPTCLVPPNNYNMSIDKNGAK